MLDRGAGEGAEVVCVEVDVVGCEDFFGAGGGGEGGGVAVVVVVGGGSGRGERGGGGGGRESRSVQLGLRCVGWRAISGEFGG